MVLALKVALAPLIFQLSFEPSLLGVKKFGIPITATSFDLFSTRDKLGGKTVILTGKVVKFMPEIMKKNWVHLQDGYSFNGFNDISITTLDKVKIDDIVTLKGKVVLNKDLGSGYKYDILIEEAVVLK